MEDLKRRKFLTIAGLGLGAVAAGVMASKSGLSSGSGLLSGLGSLPKGGSDDLKVRAVAGLPSGPIPSYASYVLEGNVNLSTRSGVLTKTVYAGRPEAMSTIALPGLSRVVRVTDVRNEGGSIHVKGTIDDASQLRAGESRDVDLWIDRSRGLARARFLSNNVALRLQT